jgi:hypothetical protein
MEEEHIVISYSHKDQDFVDELARQLRAKTSLPVWYYIEQSPGVEYVKTLMKEIERAQAIVVVLSKNSAVSDFVLSEVMHAKATNRLVIPLLLEDCHGPVTFYLKHLHWIDVRGSNDPIPQIVQSLQAKPATEDLVPLANYPSATLIAREPFTSSVYPAVFLLTIPPLVVTPSSATEIPLCTIGRHKAGQHVDVMVQQRTVSRPHAFIRLHVECPAEKTQLPNIQFILYDNATLNGTFVNGVRIENKQALRDADVIGLGVPDGMLVFSLDMSTTIPPQA